MLSKRTLKTNDSPQTAALKNTMKTNLVKRKFPRVFMRQIGGKHIRQGFALALSRLKKTKHENENILRWEDDGGQFSGLSSQTRFDTLGKEKLEQQAYKDEYLVNDSLGG